MALASCKIAPANNARRASRASPQKCSDLRPAALAERQAPAVSRRLCRSTGGGGGGGSLWALLRLGALAAAATQAVVPAAGQLAMGTPEPCTCDACFGKRQSWDLPAVGMKGFQCTAKDPGNGITCEQQGDPSTWVVQTTQELLMERFCHYSCRPIIPEMLGASVACQSLSQSEVKQFAQTSTGNGRAFLYRQQLLADSPTMADVQAIPAHS
eukprot:TRINITY_DN15083_c0_g2_i1.p1 TRINITY_DN15083_c0_g2~~TRINITY_DN15083_c0_g2_i1.p1  ORF type:complete len:225 (-),score=41.75 TRINITY_DN15083_c0_g2_i1:139-774(-)